MRLLNVRRAGELLGSLSSGRKRPVPPCARGYAAPTHHARTVDTGTCRYAAAWPTVYRGTSRGSRLPQMLMRLLMVCGVTLIVASGETVAPATATSVAGQWDAVRMDNL